MGRDGKRKLRLSMGALARFPRAVRRVCVEGFDSYRLALAVLGLNVPLILLILLRDVGARDLSWLTWFYVGNVALGYYGLPLLVIVTLLFLLLLPVRRVAAVGSAIVLVLFVYYLLLDSYIYGIFKFHVDPFWIEFALRDCESLGVPRVTLLGALAMLPGIALVEMSIYALARRFAGLKRFVLVYPVLVVLGFVVSQTLHIVTYERNDERITGLTPCLPAYVPVTSHGEAEKYGSLLSLGDDDPRETGSAREVISMRYPLGELRYKAAAAAKPPNIVIVLLESWRSDAFDERTTPNIWALGRESSVFSNHLSSGNQTTCGIFGLFYGLHATYWTAVKANSAAIDNPVLIDVLKAHGYDFGIFARSKFDRHKIKDSIFKGIDVHETFAGATIPEQDEDMTRQVMEFVEREAREKRPFCAFAFYKSSHAPYEYPPQDEIYSPVKNVGMALRADTDPAPYFNDYRNALHYEDALVGGIIEELRSLKLIGRTVVVVTTDHGESFNEDGANYWGHGSNFTRAQIQVPFILHAPGRRPGIIERRTSHIDFAPTILHDYFGCTSDARAYSNGRNLFDPSAAPRPLVIGSYVSHAFVFGDDVYEILPAYTKKYTLDHVRSDATVPPSALVKAVMGEVNRFVSR